MKRKKVQKYREGGKSKFAQNVPNFNLKLNTAGLIAGANALATEFIEKPQIRASEMKIQNDLLMAPESPVDFEGNEERLYRKGGRVDDDSPRRGYRRRTRHAGKRRNIMITEDIPMEEYIPKPHMTRKQREKEDSIKLLPRSSEMIPQREFKPVDMELVALPKQKKKVTYERLNDIKGYPDTYSPIFHGDWNRREAQSFMRNLPMEASDGVPYMRTWDTYSEMWDTSSPTANGWHMFKNGGEVYKSNPGQANVLAEGGEMFTLPDGSTDMITGESHSGPNGGEHMNLPQGTKIFSKRVKIDKDVASDILGKKVNKKMSAAKLAHKFNTEWDDKVLKELKHDPIAQRTALMTKAMKNDKMEQVFEAQERTKGPGVKTFREIPMAETGLKMGDYEDLLSTPQIKPLNVQPFEYEGITKPKDDKKGFLRKIKGGAKKAGNFLPEMIGAIQNLSDDPIFSQKFNPVYTKPTEMKVSGAYQRNYNTIAPALEQSGDPSIANARAQQAYANLLDANNNVNIEKSNFDAQNRQRTNELNTDIENRARMINMQQADQFFQKKAQREFNRKLDNQRIANSAYRKARQMKYDENALAAINAGNNNYKWNPETNKLEFIKPNTLTSDPISTGKIDPNDPRYKKTK